MTLLFLLFIPAVIAVVGFIFGKGKITWKELLAEFGVVLVLMTIGYFSGRYISMADTEISNGRIVRKDHGREGCCHSYPCNCRQSCSGSGSTRSCHTICQTCYRHSYDLWWSADASFGQVYRDGCNPPRSSVPHRWSVIEVGEPASALHSYINYIKGAKDSLFEKKGLSEKYAKYLPPYPQIHDIYRIRRVVSVEVPTPGEDLKRWNEGLSELNAVVGPSKQANVSIVLAPVEDRGFLHSLEESWLGGKKNDVVLVVGVPEYPKISWAAVMSWTKSEDMKVAIRDRVENLGTFDGDKVLAILAEEVNSKFVRRTMEEFEYLKDSIEPPKWLLILLFVLGIILSGGLKYYFWVEDPFDR